MGLTTRRNFLVTAAGAAALTLRSGSQPVWAAKPGEQMQWGMVTYLWGRDWDLPTLIANCEKSGTLGVELRTTHAHGVEVTLSAAERAEVKKRFADSPVVCLGPGSADEYDSPDPAKLAKNIESTKAFIKLSHDIGATGVKVRPNNLYDNVPHEKTIEQIGKSLNIVGKFAQDYGQEIRVEVHGRGTSEIPVCKAIMAHVTEKNVGLCWNCNGEDLKGKGLKANFDLVKKHFASTVHVRELNLTDYPYQELLNLFVAMDYKGWILLEARTNPKDRVVAMIEQRKLFDEMIAKAQATLGK